MILKNFQINKINLKLNKLILFYGKNDGFKNQAIKEILKEKKNILNYDEKEILNDSRLFIENLLSKSLFETEKVIIIKRVTDKILKIVNEIKEISENDVVIIFNAENLEKKSKLRSTFEKSKNDICIAFYPDDIQTLSKLAIQYFNEKNIIISRENINLITNKSNGDREMLLSELGKIEHFTKGSQKLTRENISKLINLNEDHSITELVNNCLAKNIKKTTDILNENNFQPEDSILIIRILLNKLKQILILIREFEKNKNIDLTISSAKPPIFWKDKEITKQQIYKWKSSNIKHLIYKLSDLEFNIKRNINISVNLVHNFIFEQCLSKTNN